VTSRSELKPIIEAVLMSSVEPLSIATLISVFEAWEKPEPEMVQDVLNQLTEEYKGRGVELTHVASGYVFQTRSQYASWIWRLCGEKPAKYSHAFLETLAIIAYKQPVTRADIEDIRGVSSSSTMIKAMLERGWIRVAGFRDVPGKPAVYTTTKAFLDYFNLKGLGDLPPLETSKIHEEG
jgi:segregation and condensation protein B